MSIKKKGTPEKLRIVKALEELKKVVEKATGSEVEVKLVNKSKQKKDK